MELNKILIILILVIFFKTGNVLSEEDIFNVNNVKLIKKANNSYEELTNKAINKGFKELIDRILLDKDRDKLAKMNFQEVKRLVSYYQISGNDCCFKNTLAGHTCQKASEEMPYKYNPLL